MKDLNLPNILTLLRVISAPIFIYLILQESQLYRLMAFLLFSLASFTDLVDGYLARKLKQETELGKFLDPLADKFLVLGAFLTFLFISNQVQVWMVLCIIGRDMLITVLRYLSIRQGTTLHTSIFAKIKTSFQMFSILLILISLALVSYRETAAINKLYLLGAEQGISPWRIAWENMNAFLQGTSNSTSNSTSNGTSPGIAYAIASFLPFYLMVFTTTITLVSGLRYLVTNYALLLPPYRRLE